MNLFDQRDSLVIADQPVLDDVLQFDVQQVGFCLLHLRGAGLQFERTEQSFVVFTLDGPVRQRGRADLFGGLQVLLGESVAAVYGLLDRTLQRTQRFRVVLFGDAKIVQVPVDVGTPRQTVENGDAQRRRNVSASFVSELVAERRRSGLFIAIINWYGTRPTG